MTDRPRAHILRPVLPWRLDERVTECGRDAAEFAEVWTRDEVIAHVDKHGKQRTAFVCCMSCLSTADRHPLGWEASPSSVMFRHGQGWSRRAADSANLLDSELRAIAALVEAHRDEFDGYLSGLDDTVDLASRRRVVGGVFRGSDPGGV